jgi:hypothetical protein
MTLAAEFTERDMGMNRIIQELKLIDRSYTMVGFPDGKDKTRDDGKMTNATLAAIHEYGVVSQGIPSRPFMRQSVDGNIEDIQKVSNRLLQGIYAGKYGTRKALGRLGEYFTGVIKQTIDKQRFKPLKPATISRKKSSKILIDTSVMRNSITHKEVIS